MSKLKEKEALQRRCQEPIDRIVGDYSNFDPDLKNFRDHSIPLLLWGPDNMHTDNIEAGLDGLFEVAVSVCPRFGEYSVYPEGSICDTEAPREVAGEIFESIPESERAGFVLKLAEDLCKAYN